jgi:cell division protein FtsL
MTIEEILIVLLGVVVIVELFVMYLMRVRMQQLQREIEDSSSRVDLSDIELEALTRNVEAFKRLKI